ncbi:type III polyketide synthase [Paenibacillus septentrionalis]|uniref:Type III polyketide synthase n=1 Tax=Paenibacillus septentrionalis TaxID=429342 RepID=A0ABW1V3F1_9BACL
MNATNPKLAILGIGTAVPEYRLNQADTAQRLSEALSHNTDSARWAKRLFKQCGVENRYTCEPNLLEKAQDCRYFSQQSLQAVPTTAERMEIYKRESLPLALRAARNALQDGHADGSEISHLITVSCTGQFLPGLDTELVQQLGLAPNVKRIPLNFLGCAAGLRAVCLAKELAAHQHGAKVLIVSVELCTLHIQPSSKREDLFGASFFGDGASACIVGHASEEVSSGHFLLGDDHSVVLQGGAADMVWEVGNFGFDLYLSTTIPKLIGQFVPEQISTLVGNKPVNLWAIHPGGRGIIEKLADVYGLSEEQTRPSHTILRDYGNMSSATILFVLKEMKRELEEAKKEMTSGIALAFGPGLTCEMIQITYVPRVQPELRQMDEAYV